MNIYITGFMGTGKTEVGKELARAKHWHFVDLDDLIEQRQGKSIAEIFRDKGEAYFRTLEKDLLEEVSHTSEQVVSCGGGIVIDKGNIAVMKKTGLVVCLAATPEVILERTKKFTHRPLLNAPDPKEKIASLLKDRACFYAQADIVIDTSTLSAAEAARLALAFIERKK